MLILRLNHEIYVGNLARCKVALNNRRQQETLETAGLKIKAENCQNNVRYSLRMTTNYNKIIV